MRTLIALTIVAALSAQVPITEDLSTYQWGGLALVGGARYSEPVSKSRPCPAGAPGAVPLPRLLDEPKTVAGVLHPAGTVITVYYRTVTSPRNRSICYFGPTPATVYVLVNHDPLAPPVDVAGVPWTGTMPVLRWRIQALGSPVLLGPPTIRWPASWPAPAQVQLFVLQDSPRKAVLSPIYSMP
jgi:hypothetical protein